MRKFNSLQKFVKDYFIINDARRYIKLGDFEESYLGSAEENFIIWYLLSLLQTGKSYPAIRSSVFAIKYFHKIVGHHDPCNSELVNYVFEGIKRIWSKKPFTPQLLHILYRSLGKNNMNLINHGTMLLFVLSCI